MFFITDHEDWDAEARRVCHDPHLLASKSCFWEVVFLNAEEQKNM